MPAINVARTDTFEQQRVKINQIGTALFNVTSGGSDLATGNLKIGDGSLSVPSLAFDNDQSLGFYRADTGVIGYVSAGKLLYQTSETGFLSYRNFTFRKTEINDSGIGVTNVGSNYDPGTYTNIPVIGGTGSNATIDIVVGDFTGTESSGANYTPGSFFSIPVVGGNTATRSLADFEVEPIVVDITNAGSGYTDGVYTGVSLLNGSGTGAVADVTISGGVAYAGNITGGSGYTDGNYTQSLRNEAKQTYVVTVTGSPGSYAFVLDGNTQPTLNWEAASTYRFDVSDSSNTGHVIFLQGPGQVSTPPNGLTLTAFGTPGQQGAYVDVVVENGYSLSGASYNCVNHSADQMGGDINFTTGTPGVYGSGAVADLTVSGGALTTVTFVTTGTDYKVGDILEVPPFTIGAGTGAEFEITAVNPAGIVTAVTITNSGQDYLINDILSINSADVGGTGSNAQLTITSEPGIVKNFSFVSSATDYLAGDVITFPVEQTGVSATLVGEDLGSTVPELTFTVADVSNIVAGSTVVVTGGTGVLGAGTTLVQGIDYDANTVTIDNNPATSGPVTLTFSPPYGNATTPFTYTISAVGPVDSVTVSNGGVGYFDGDSLSVVATDLVQPITYFVVALNLQELTLGPTAVPAGTFSANQSITLRDGTPTATSLSSSTSLTPNSVGPLATTLTTTTNQIVLSSTSGISAGYIVTSTGTGVIGPNVVVASVDSGTQVTLSANPIASGAADLTFTEDISATYTSVQTTTNSANGSGETLTIQRGSDGSVSSVVSDQVGYFYSVGDTITVSGALVGGATPADDITVVVDAVTDLTPSVVREVNESGGFTTSILVDEQGYFDGSIFVVEGTNSPAYTAVTASSTRYGYTINTGSGAVYTPDITLYEGNTYTFDVSDASMSGQDFSLSEFPGGIWGNGYIENIASTVTASSTTIGVSDSTGIIPGMLVNFVSGTGQLQSETKVVSIQDINNVIVDKAPITTGTPILEFRGYAYEEGVTEDASTLTIKVLNTTPTLYYYSNNSDPSYANAGGSPGSEATITNDPNNPKVFGSGFTLDVITVGSIDIIKNDIASGQLDASTVVATTGLFDNITASQNVNSSAVNTTTLAATIFNTGSGLSVSGGTISISGPNVNIGSGITVENLTGNITSSGVIKSTQEFNSNNKLTITESTISTLGANDIILQPAANRIAKTTGTTAFVIPSGDTSQRPSLPIAQDGAIRFNTQTNQYEGYSSSSASWSSLGGVRDLDGNTYISAEATVGANDNTLYFYNDNQNTLRVTTTYLDFYSTKKIRSSNISAPSNSLWTANKVVALGDFIRYKRNIYEVTAVPLAPTTPTLGGTGAQPTHTTGTASNGNVELTFSVTAVSDLTFEECSEVRIGPTDITPLVINQKLRFSQNIISTDTDDLILQPNSGQNAVVQAATALVIPVGDINQRAPIASAITGSIRFNTTDTQFEGFDGSQWGSLGGVKDADQDTLIKAETAPGSDEDTLYFVNANVETVKLTVNGLEFSGIDTINVTSAVPGAQVLAINADTITLDNNATTIDNTDSTRSFLFASKQYLDLGVSSGIYNDPVLRLDDQGDVFLNTGFGTGVYNGVKIFDSDLKEFELADYKIATGDLTFIKGTIDQGSIVLYDPITAIGCKVTVAALNTTTGDKELVEYTVIDNGTDISFTDFGNVKTGADLFNTVFDFNASNNVRATLSTASGLASGNNIIISITVNVYKR